MYSFSTEVVCQGSKGLWGEEEEEEEVVGGGGDSRGGVEGVHMPQGR